MAPLIPLIRARTGAHDLDAILIGRAGMDLYPLPVGTKTADATSFKSDMGGSSGNIAAAMARLGCTVGLAAPVSDDPVGAFVRRTLADFGIEHLTPQPVTGEPRTSLAFAELIANGSQTVIYRNNAADFMLEAAQLSPQVARAPLALVTGTALAAEPSRTASLAALDLSPCGVLDLDYRPYSWASDAEAQAIYAKAAEHAAIIVGNDEEFAILSGGTDPRSFAESMGAQKIVLFKEGAAGCTAFCPGQAPQFLAAFSVEAMKPFGAGDAFLGGTLAALIQGADLPTAMTRGAAGAALVVTRPGCASAMPTAAEIDTFLTENEAP